MSDRPHTPRPSSGPTIIEGEVVGKSSVKPRRNWILRPVFGLLLGGIAIGAVYQGGWLFALFVGVAVTLAAWEWHRMVAVGRYKEEFLLTCLIMTASVAASLQNPQSTMPWLILALGAGLSFILAFQRQRRAVWELMGILYLGIPAIAMVLLRLIPADGFWIIVILFASIWATDTGALFVGKLLGGPKLWPALSPNKTWAGFLGGTLFAMAAGAGLFAFLTLDITRGAMLAAAISLAAHCGDLLESSAKRHFRIKDSGGLIPGHGGVLDRIDSTLLAAPLLALVVLVAGINIMGR